MTDTNTPDRRWLLLFLSAFVILADRLSKHWIEAHIALGSAIDVIHNVFRLTHVLNLGAAFSMGEGSSSPNLVRNLLITFTLIAVAVVLVLIWKLGRTLNPTTIAFALILGGALGNLYDRVVYHHVVDFLEVHIVRYHFPDFNVADSCIVIGACLILLEMLWPRRTAND